MSPNLQQAPWTYDDYLNALCAAATQTFSGSGDGARIAPANVPCDLFEGLVVTEIANWTCVDGDDGDADTGTGVSRGDDTDPALTPIADPP